MTVCPCKSQGTESQGAFGLFNPPNALYGNDGLGHRLKSELLGPVTASWTSSRTMEKTLGPFLSGGLFRVKCGQGGGGGLNEFRQAKLGQ